MFKKVISLAVSVSFIFQSAGFAQAAQLNLAGYLGQGTVSIERFRPASLRYFSYEPMTDNFQVLLDKADEKDLNDAQVQEKTQELMKYFRIGLSLPNEKFWVNLRPDAPEQIIDPELEKTDIGKVMLEADLQLKKDTSSLTSPQTKEGKEYWDKLYKRAGELFGNENITIPTITRPWIVPGEIIVRESANGAYIYKAALKVMLEEDYLRGTKEVRHKALADARQSSVAGERRVTTIDYSFNDPRLKELNEYSTQLIRELIIPNLTKEVNRAKRYSALRQVYYSLILARWFKERFSSQSTAQGNNHVKLIDSRDLTNLTSKESWDKITYFSQYKDSFNKGEYNLSETVRTPSGQVIRRYVSGGAMLLRGPKSTGNYGSDYPIITSDNAVPLTVAKDGAITLSSPLVGENNSLKSPLEIHKERFNEIVSSLKQDPLFSSFIEEAPKVKLYAGENFLKFITQAKNLSALQELIEDFKSSFDNLILSGQNAESDLFVEETKDIIELAESIDGKIKNLIAQILITAGSPVEYNILVIGDKKEFERFEKANKELLNRVQSKGGKDLNIRIDFIGNIEDPDFERKISVANTIYVSSKIKELLKQRGVIPLDAKSILGSVDAEWSMIALTPKLRIKDADNAAGSPINKKLLENYRNIIDSFKEYAEGLSSVSEHSSGEHIAANNLFHGIPLPESYYNRKQIKLDELLDVIEKDKEFLNKYLTSFFNILHTKLRENKVLTNTEWYNKAINYIRLSLDNLDSLAKRAEEAAQSAGSPEISSSLTPEETAAAGSSGWKNMMRNGFNKKGLSPDYLDSIFQKNYKEYALKKGGFLWLGTTGIRFTNGRQYILRLQRINPGGTGNISYRIFAESMDPNTKAEYAIIIPTGSHDERISVTSSNERLKLQIENEFGGLTRNTLEGFVDNVMSELKELASSALTVGETAIPGQEGVPVGGIDFRQMNMLVKPMGSLSGLDFSPARLSSSALEAIDLDKDLEGIKRMASSGIVPSPVREKEYVSACILKGRLEDKADDFVLAMQDVFQLQVEEGIESSPQELEALVMADTRNYCLPRERLAGSNSHSLN